MFSHVQSAFILGRSILDNVMIAIEIIHYLKSKTKGNVGDVALKVDTSKTYDKINWEYLRRVMLRLCFDAK